MTTNLFLDSLLEEELTILKRQGLYRELRCVYSAQGPTVDIDGKEVILFSSNNYLGLSTHPEIIKAQKDALERFGAGACASRLISGNIHLYEELEKTLADFKHTESSLVFPTGYMANIGTISAMVGDGDLVICDKLNHASIIDGCRLSGARLRVYPHKDLERLKQLLKKELSFKKRLIITDGVFSMDGDIAPLPDIVEIAKSFGAFVMVDDAHATGVLGENGRGTCEYFGIKDGIDIQMGTFSKAFGCLGGYIAGSKALIDYIRNKARSFIYTTALPPSIIAGCIKAIEIVKKDETLRKNLWKNVERFKTSINAIGLDTMATETQIIPIFTGDINSTIKASQLLFESGIYVPGIRPPTVPKNKCRLRVSIMATHSDIHIDKAIEVFKRLKDEGVFCNRN